MSPTPGEAEAMRVVHAYLSAGGPGTNEVADLVVGLGHFDREIPRLCGALVAGRRARWVAFAGGVGAGSGDFTQAEALEFREELRRHWPGEEPRLVAWEARSTNTGENFEFLAAELARVRPDLRPGRGGVERAIVVTTPCRLRRALATARRHWPEVTCTGAAPMRTWEEDAAMYARQGQALRDQLTGEIERLIAYPGRGFIAPVDVPPEVLAAARRLGARG